MDPKLLIKAVGLVAISYLSVEVAKRTGILGNPRDDDTDNEGEDTLVLQKSLHRLPEEYMDDFGGPMLGGDSAATEAEARMVGTIKAELTEEEQLRSAIMAMGTKDTKKDAKVHADTKHMGNGKEVGHDGTVTDVAKQLRAHASLSDANLKRLKPVPLFVMCPLDMRRIPLEKLTKWFGKLKNAGAHGVMMDFWWSIAEKYPGKYDWSDYDPILIVLKELGLKVQAVMSFHVCGECDGDEAYVPLPQFVTNLAKTNPSILFLDERGVPSYECLSFGVDHERIFPGPKGPNTRTALEMYTDFMTNFRIHFADYIPNTIVEVQVGLGPSGELRYPSYSLSKWQFPGIGAFQCYDNYLAKSCFWKTWVSPPQGVLPDYNQTPDKTSYFCENGTVTTRDGRTFMRWYFDTMYNHGDDMLKRANSVFKNSGVKLSAKVAGIHWFAKHPTRAAECIAGYYINSSTNLFYQFNAYKELANLFKWYGVTFLFTCFEKKDIDEMPEAMASPELLVRETSDMAVRTNVSFGGENALQFYDLESYQMVLDQINHCQMKGVNFVSFTLLRLDEKLITGKNYILLRSFVKQLSMDF